MSRKELLEDKLWRQKIYQLIEGETDRKIREKAHMAFFLLEHEFRGRKSTDKDKHSRGPSSVKRLKLAIKDAQSTLDNLIYVPATKEKHFKALVNKINGGNYASSPEIEIRNTETTSSRVRVSYTVPEYESISESEEVLSLSVREAFPDSLMHYQKLFGDINYLLNKVGYQSHKRENFNSNIEFHQEQLLLLKKNVLDIFEWFRKRYTKKLKPANKSKFWKKAKKTISMAFGKRYTPAPIISNSSIKNPLSTEIIEILSNPMVQRSLFPNQAGSSTSDITTGTEKEKDEEYIGFYEMKF